MILTDEQIAIFEDDIKEQEYGPVIENHRRLLYICKRLITTLRFERKRVKEFENAKLKKELTNETKLANIQIEELNHYAKTLPRLYMVAEIAKQITDKLQGFGKTPGIIAAETTRLEMALEALEDDG